MNAQDEPFDCMQTVNTSTDVRIWRQLASLFFLSGFAALTYQVAWQRKLFSVVGIDVVSVAIIVSAFMLGLGIGGVIGGFIADRKQSLVSWFAGLEFGIGVFGLMSTSIIGWLGYWLPTADLPSIVVFSLIVLLLPTALMGATLPILVIHVNRTIANVGVSTGVLYFYNTLGAALGALSTGFLFFERITLTQSTLLAALINFFIATSALLLNRGKRT